jgi:hypothetical protein
MEISSRRLPVIAVHEAGHAVATCRYNFGFHAVHVGVLGPGRLGTCESRSPFSDDLWWLHISNSPFVGDSVAPRREAGFRAMIELMAGPIAEARHKRCSLAGLYLAVWHTGERDSDYQKVHKIAKYLASDTADEKALFETAEAEAKRCVSRYRDAINDLARTLIERRSVAFEDAPASVHAVPRLEFECRISPAAKVPIGATFA